MKIRKVVIPAAGFGTRFLPQTKAIPKEMLPIVDKPVIQYVVEEAVASGIEDVVIVTGYSKRTIEDHFDSPNADLINNLKLGHKEHMIESIQKIADMANFIYIRQKGPYGNGTPVLTAEPIIGNEAFAVMWGDEFIYSQPPRLAQMMEVYEKYGGVVISGVRIEKESLSRYGIADIDHVEGNVFKIKKIVEKPAADEAPSDLATHGAYILPPSIFGALKSVAPGKGDEIWLVDAINILRDQGVPIYACEIENGKYYDTGNKLEYMKTVIDLALQHPDVNGELKEYLRTLNLD
ncbi:UTP--glucose-1-phosphate uridylyltransferase [Candidatus Roizmanbacteria bacterium RIFCSPHIGHO2_02_FULL_40_13b]|uniref:UTP--glucose-1-phosphate uridylyltransferase n=1 Tax=Candidatus Roizmanbacteria bacterium RIFCSPHIGHO2_01_FULL_39_24 TaxID=1802032 RepID=A0A1F7GIN7_9BACT|nr:MAG: UTP--glucose-1-phosphate uridylyltransferase [Candidatus Roizmanbacteria bacterium RIFCSPHIGHO2_01_FULL_39_24]OGK26504.1 MAG: UTP--glucose-1-phosphate uridylyltransferase [Candidatus Roizmanbacteria bacterium RIFCSPHIGHO2_02_FULL_40_13b]OGK50354.1 MAG: UTP--glucose-1-phosphate uridylyltransferase [Candidatus Roizmanbacteria bacterium RIFCSPLOWO2_01_FULL_40_32]OGK56199.1 MAG: UTP--glucose-1-phosphate uridylyltransferase [Candidatus Roizmanbacteria bacterium RIFCSPLOWO2_02_FULL_39_8]